jgi:hypothetical protein
VLDHRHSISCSVFLVLVLAAGLGAQADLSVTSVDASAAATAPQTLTLTGSASALIANLGAAAAGAFDVTFFEDRDHDSAFSAGDLVLGQAAVAGLAPGGSATATAAVSGAVLFRGNLIWAFADSAGAVAEPDETNNLESSGAACVYQPAGGAFSPVLEWSWTASATLPSELNVMSTPAVIDLDGDDVADVIFGATASTGGGLVESGHLRALNGDSGTELFTVTTAGQEVNTAASVAVGDIDGDGLPEIVACHASGNRLICFENDGTLKWLTSPLEAINWGAPAIADLDQDGVPEIVIGRQALTNAGTLLWTGIAGNGSGGSTGPLSLVSDIDQDGSPDVVAGNSAYSSTGALLFQQAAVTDGYAAVANFDADQEAEIVVVGGGSVWCLEHTGAIVWGPIAIPGGGYGGPPTIADYDADGLPEIGVAGAARYVVLEHTGAVKWQMVTQDGSSNRSGSSVFDFEGDGVAEVVYRDELFLRVYRGSDGFVLFQVPMSSCTWHEYVLVADVDGDANAEIVAVANVNCGFGTQQGVYVFGSATDDWVATRPLWNQHTYHVTNILDDGTIPQVEPSNWLTPAGAPYNNFRQNLLPGAQSPQAAPDITASFLRFDCQSSGTITVRVGNGGAVIVGTGLPVSFYDGDPAAGGVLLGTAATSQALPPGTFQDVTLFLPPPFTPAQDVYAVADDAGGSIGTENECDETNNVHSAAATPVCTTPAAANVYGVGWPGTLGIPPLNGAAPVLGTTSSITFDNSRGAPTVVHVLVGPLPKAQVTAIGGTLLVDYDTVLTLTITPFQRTFGFPAPCDPAYCGAALYVQVVEYDEGASGDYSFSNGLELIFGI